MKTSETTEQKIEELLASLGMGLSEARAKEIKRLEDEIAIRKKKKYRKRIYAAVIAICILGASISITTVASDALRAKLFGFFFSEQDGYSDVIKNPENTETNTANILYPSYLPSGFVKVQDEDTDLMHILQYQNEKRGEEILIEQIKDKDLAYSLDTETSQKEQVLLKDGQEGYYIYGDDNHILLWEQQGIYMQITSNLKKEPIIKIANGLN